MKAYFYQLMTDQKRGPWPFVLKGGLWFLSLLYGVAVRLVLLAYRLRILKTHKLKVPVISVGNITVGGSGKTPLVQRIAVHLKEKGYRPAILLRGYMDRSFSMPRNPLSDEALLLEASLPQIPVLVGKDRIKNAEQALKEDKADIFIMDDGFQHWRLFRDLDIVVINTNDPFGNGHLIPRGTLREPFSSLSRADCFVLTKTDSDKGDINMLKERLEKINPKTPIVETVHQPTALLDLLSQARHTLDFLKGRPICAFCSIGDPSAFLHTLTSLKADIRENFFFMDHHQYRREDVDTITAFCRNNQIDTLLTTQKDAVKLEKYLPSFDRNFSLFSLPIMMHITKGEDEFFHRILRLLQR